MRIGIMGAMPEEVSGIIEAIGGRSSTWIGGREYWEGSWQGCDVVAVFSRWGKVASAVTTAVLVDRFAVDHVLFVGVAGATDPSLRLADVVVASELLQHDMDASAIPPFQRFEIPLLGKTRFSTDARAADSAVGAARAYLDEQFGRDVPEDVRATFAIRSPAVRLGLVASGDRFVSESAQVAKLRAALPDLSCVEMEGGAVAQACFEFAVPLSLVRIVSDHADHQAPVDFPRFASQVASVMTKGIAERLLPALRCARGEPALSG